MMAKTIEKMVKVDDIELSICKIGTKREAYRKAFEPNYHYAEKDGDDLIVGEDLGVYVLLKNGQHICAVNDEAWAWVPKQAEIAAIIFSHEAGWEFYNEDKVRICFGEEPVSGEFVDLEFVSDMSCGGYYDEIKTFAEI